MRDGGLAAAAPLEAAHGPSLRPKTPQGSPSCSSVAGSAGGRLRAVRLVRRKGETYGFSLRGGKEHGTGFFVSHVEPGSEAFLQGLRAGDQVVRVNNLTVDQAVHREVTAMVQSKGSVLLHIRSTGIIPLKEHRSDPLTWLVVDDDEELSDHGTDSYGTSMEATPPPQHHSSHQTGYARIYLNCSSKVGLGCSICKGPPEKPGIFVQSVKVGGVARNAGLRPGDQVIACNDVSFAHLEFAEAVYVLKSSPRLVVDVLRGAGLDLVAGESSGYNSSASSVAGDQTPPSSSSSDPRDSDHSIASRLSAVSRHLTLDRSRNWQDIENEWAEAEAADKRRQLQASQKTLKTRAQRDASHRLGNIASRSLGSLSVALQEEEYEEQRTAFRDPKPSSIYPSSRFSPTHPSLKATLRSSRSTDDVSEDTSHKIALLTSADPHVNNIVVTGGPKDEQDAVFRLDQLSSPSASRTSTLSSGTSQVTVQSSGSGGCPSPGKAAPPRTPESLVEQQLQELRREHQRLQEEANRLAEERRKFEDVQYIEAKLDQFKKDKSVKTNPKMAQHAKLLEEIKIKQKKMLSKDNMGDEVKEEETEKKEEGEEEGATKWKLKLSPRAPSPPPSPVEFSSKIISKSRMLNQNKEETSHVKPATVSLTNGIATKPTATISATTTKSRVGIGGTPSKLPVSKTTSIPVNKLTSSATKAAVFETQQWSERMRGSNSVNKGPSPAVPSKPRSHSTATAVTVMEEFRLEDKMSQKSLKPPSAYFEPQKKTTSGKPLVSISTYPSPNHRPTPVKMDFLPQSSSKIEVNGVSVVNTQFPKAVLQNELKSTLTRSNLRQRSIAEQVFEGGPLPPPASASTNTSTKPSFTTTTVLNTATPPKASLSSKYSSIGQGTKGESSKENEAPECPPAGILKPSSGPPTSIRPLQKSISFGDV